MKKNASKLFKTFVAVSMSAVMLTGGSLSAAASVPDDNAIMPMASATFNGKTVSKGTTVQFNTSVKKSIANVNASVTMHTKIPADDQISTFVRDTKGNIVSTQSATFRGTTSMAIGEMPYRTDMGKKGYNYYLNVTLSNSSKSNSLEITCNFIP
ncbi:MAG: hypothetical protein HFH72_07180 [Lachnospiraceae bacterium]|nr:hypothetical protein [Lachnospiraceae bacterium]